MSDPIHDEHRRLIREVRQRLEALARAGVDRIPAPVAAAQPAAPRGESAAAARRPCPAAGVAAAGPAAAAAPRRRRAAAPARRRPHRCPS